MAKQNSEYLNGYQLTVGRRVLILRTIVSVAEEEDDPLIEERAQAALLKEAATWEIVKNWERSRDERDGARPEAMALDKIADRALSGAYNGAHNFVRNLPQDHPLHKLGEEFISEFFPDGVAAVTNQAYEDQLPTMENHLNAWQGPWKTRLEKLNLTLFADQLKEVIPLYETALVTPKRRAVTFDQVRAAQAASNNRFAGVIALVIGLHAPDTPESNKLRRRYLKTYEDQQERVGDYHRRRRPVPDVDMDTGEEFDDIDAPNDI